MNSDYTSSDYKRRKIAHLLPAPEDGRSIIDRIKDISHSKEEKEEFFEALRLKSNLSETQFYSQVKYMWELWARPKQMIPQPDTEWRTWCILAGRGFGKTRTGAETVRQWIEQGVKRIALVGPTAADVRDVMIKGQSGLLSIFPPENKPEYSPTNRIVTWKNGAIASAYSAEEPERLRGPQHEKAWADELCLVAGTLIETEYGSQPIEIIKEGQRVFTRQGLKRVKSAWKTSDAAVVFQLSTEDGNTLTGTANHPVWVENKGFCPLQSIVSGDILKVWNIKLNQALSGEENVGGLIEDITVTDKVGSYIEQFMRQFMVQFQKESRFTIKTKISLITQLTILRDLLDLNTLSDTGHVAGGHFLKNNDNKFPLKRGLLKSHMKSFVEIVKSLIRVPEQELNFVRLNANLPIDELTSQNMSNTYVGIVELNFKQENIIMPQYISALKYVNFWQKINNSKRVLYASKLLRRLIQERCVAQKHADINIAHCVAKKVKRLKELYPVYNLEIEDCPEYYANGILTHNCSWRYQYAWDMLKFGLRLGNNPQTIVTTTPKPIPILLDVLKSPRTWTTEGTTFENAGNIASSFIEDIEEKYGNTPLGQQELYAELVEEVPGALWSRENLDFNRIEYNSVTHELNKPLPDFLTTVLAIDPAGTSGKKSAETGMCVVAYGADGHFYVLELNAYTMTPEQWANKAKQLFVDYECDKLVAETNYGGEMVKSIIRTVDPFMVVHEVHARDGKRTRAEPVASLYTQNKVHHVGHHARAEEQMCSFNPLENPHGGKDMVDALVWGMLKIIDDYRASKGQKPIVAGIREKLIKYRYR